MYSEYRDVSTEMPKNKPKKHSTNLAYRNFSV